MREEHALGQPDSRDSEHALADRKDGFDVTRIAKSPLKAMEKQMEADLRQDIIGVEIERVSGSQRLESWGNSGMSSTPFSPAMGRRGENGVVDLRAVGSRCQGRDSR
jgi:hypothetical protein